MCCRRIRTTWLTYEQNVKPNTLLFSKLVRVAHGHDIKKPKLLHLSGIWFAYPGTKPTICNTNWELPIGQMVKLAGGNGVGKSTLLKLMAGLLEPQVGQICLNKKPYAEINIRTIRHVIIYVSSNSYWFAGNIHDNLCYHVGRSHNINLSYLTGVLEITGVNSLINRLPQGLNTVVTTGGENFSSGERQRLALIRVLLARPSYVLLDEALSSISHDDASDILRQMKSYLGPTTSIVYVHHGVDCNLPNQHNVILDNSNLVMV